MVVISTLDDYWWSTVAAFWKAAAAAVCTHWNSVLLFHSQSWVVKWWMATAASAAAVVGDRWKSTTVIDHYCLWERETFWWVFVSSTLSVREAVSCFFCFCWSYSSLVLRLEIGTAAAAVVFLLFSPLIGQLDWLTERLRERGKWIERWLWWITAAAAVSAAEVLKLTVDTKQTSRFVQKK